MAKRKTAPLTIDNDNGEPVVSRIPALQRDNPLEGIAEGYANIYDGLMNKSIDPKSAGQMNTSLRGKLQTHQAGFDIGQRAKLGDEFVRNYAAKLLGIVGALRQLSKMIRRQRRRPRKKPQ